MGYTSEYLHAFREKAKELLPDWMVHRIHQEAQPLSGGRARHRPTIIDNTTATYGTQKTDLEQILSGLVTILDPETGEAIAPDVVPDVAPEVVPDEEGRLDDEDAAEVLLRGLWRWYMAHHFPPGTEGEDEDEPAEIHSFLAEKSELLREVRFWKAEGEPQQIVYGVVLVPEQVDSQGDIVGADEIESAAHRFLTQYRESGLQHIGPALPSLEVIESYIAPIDMEVGGNPVPKGAWVMAVKINDPEIWQMVLDGVLTGFSIQGWATSDQEAA